LIASRKGGRKVSIPFNRAYFGISDNATDRNEKRKGSHQSIVSRATANTRNRRKEFRTKYR